MFSGLYINLDKRPDRRVHMEKEFARFGVSERYKRIRAIADTIPGLGCSRSHLKALDVARQIGGIVHILEDDSILSSALVPFLESDEALAVLDRYDILFLDMWIDSKKDAVDLYQSVIDSGQKVMPLTGGSVRIGSMSSYVIAPNRFGKIRRLWRRSLDDIPIDDICNEFAKDGSLTAAVTVPFLTGVDLNHGTSSDIQVAMPRAEQSRLVMLRTRFFADRKRQPFL